MVENKNKIIMWVLIVLGVVICAVGAYVVYNVIGKEDQNITAEKTEDQKLIEELDRLAASAKDDRTEEEKVEELDKLAASAKDERTEEEIIAELDRLAELKNADIIEEK